MNRSDAERLEGVLAGLGYGRTEDEKEASLIAIVACSVRQSAIDHVIRRAGQWQKRRRQGQLKTVLTGCVLDQDRKRMSELFDVVLPVTEIGKIGEMINDSVSDGHASDYLSLPPNYDSKFQAYVPIMTGCDNFCSYCAVPYTRGREKSRPVQEVVDECRELITKGYKEITLLGQNVNSYRGLLKHENIKTLKQETPNMERPMSEAVSEEFLPFTKGEMPGGRRGLKDSNVTFPELLQKIDGIEGDYWLRFATSHPKDLSDELIGAIADGKHITPYLHLALQSGDDEILKAMNRKYTAKHYEELVAKARAAMPGLMISTDIIVGFPGETEEQFQNTAAVMERVGFDMAYLSEYSPREGTAAAKLVDDVPADEKSRRKEFLNDILKKTGLANNEKHIGREVTVLVDEFKNGKCSGKTDTYKTVVFDGDESMVGQFVKVKIHRVDNFALFGN